MVSRALLSQDVSHVPLPFASMLVILTNCFAVICLGNLLVVSHLLIVRLDTYCSVVSPGLLAGDSLSWWVCASCGASFMAMGVITHGGDCSGSTVYLLNIKVMFPCGSPRFMDIWKCHSPPGLEIHEYIAWFFFSVSCLI